MSRIAIALSTLALLVAGRTAGPGSARGPETIEELRRQGPAGLETFLRLHERELEAIREVLPGSRDRSDLLAALDAICQQYDCLESKLYWYTDWAEARAAAHPSVKPGKPILALRLLGNLSEELSCANSRFFRAALYSDPEISGYLRDRFVLHWQSVRPVPRVTIDFGDGRTIERTLTGNSIHYILDSQGRLVDALPGLYGPGYFLPALKRAERAALESASLTDEARRTYLRQFHQGRLMATASLWHEDLRRLGLAPGVRSFEALEAATNEAAWEKIAGLHTDTARAADASWAIAQKERSTATEAMRLAVTKAVFEMPLLRLAGLSPAVALDTVRNEYLLHRRIHEWLGSDGGTLAVDQLNDRVYAELFLTPNDDPWLGLQ